MKVKRITKRIYKKIKLRTYIIKRIHECKETDFIFCINCRFVKNSKCNKKHLNSVKWIF